MIFMAVRFFLSHARTHNVALSDYRRLNKKGGYAPPNAAGGTGTTPWSHKTNGPTTEGFQQIIYDYILLLVFWWSCTIFFLGFESIEEVSNQKQIRNTNHQESMTVAILSRPPVTIFASTYVVSQHLGWWPEKILPVTRQEAARWGTSNPSWRQQEGGPWVFSVLPWLVADSWWRCGRRQPPSRPKRPSWKKPRWEEKVTDWNHEMQFCWFPFLLLLATVFFCVVYVCHLKIKKEGEGSVGYN